MTDTQHAPQQPGQYPQQPQQAAYPQQPHQQTGYPQTGYPQQPYAPAPQPAAKPQRNVLGIVALVLAGLGFLFACMPGALILGWILLPVSFILGIVGVCLKGRAKWQALTAMIVAAVGTIVGFIVFFAVVATAFDNSFASGDVSVGSEPSAVAEEAAPAVEEAPVVEEAAAGTRENPLAFGTPISNDEWDVTLTAFERNGNAVVVAGNAYNDPPADGFQYVVLDLGATYKGSGEGSSMMVEVDYVTADGTVISSWDSFVAGVEPAFGSATLYAGANDTGKIVFEVPSTLDGLIRVSPGLFSNDDIFFTLP